MSDKELTQLCKELSSQIVLAHLVPLPKIQTTNKHVNIELAKLSHIKITAKFDKILHNVCSQISTNSATLYRLCHRKPEMSLSSISTSGTFTDDIAVCVLSTIMQEQPNLWSALCYRAILMKPKRPILRLGMTLLIVITIKEVKQFTNRAKQVLNLTLPRSCKRQRQRSQEHQQKEKEENELPEREHTETNVKTCSEKEQVAVINKLEIANNTRIHKELSSSSSSSSSTTLLDDEQAEFVSVHYFVRVTSIQEQIRTPALISMRAHDKRQHCNLTKVSGDIINHESTLNTSEGSNDDTTHKKCINNNQNITDSLTNAENSWSNDNFYLESNKEELMIKENDNINGDGDDALRTTSNLPSYVVSSLLITGLWSKSTNNWLQLITDIKRCKQTNQFAKLSHLISNPLLLASHECHNRRVEQEENNQTRLSNLNMFNNVSLSRKSNANEKNCESTPSLQEMSLSPVTKLVGKACYITSKFVWARLLICGLWQLMLESMQTDDTNSTSEFCENVAKLSARFILQAHKWNAETHCPVCDELQLERAPIHWSLIQEDRKELNRQLVPFMQELQRAQTGVNCSYTTAPCHIQLQEEELYKEKESKHEESRTQKESINTQNLTEQHACKNVHHDNRNSDTRSTSVDRDQIDANMSNSHYIHLLWSNLCKCTTFKQFCNVLRKGSNAKTSSSCCTSTTSYSTQSVEYEEEKELCVTEADVATTTTAADNDNRNGRIEKNEVQCDQEITHNMREVFVVALTHRLQALVQLLETVTQAHYSMQVNNFMHHGEVHTSKEEQYSTNSLSYVNIKGKRVHLDDHNNLVLRNHGWVIGDNAEFTLGQWISSSLPSLYLLVTREWLNNISISWCANMLCESCKIHSEYEDINSTKHNMPNMDVKNINNSNINNNNKKACCKEQLEFTPIVPFLLCKDKIVECVRCFAWFHHRCIAPPQDCFIDNKFMCHGCRLLVCKELQCQSKSQKEKLHQSHKKLPQDFVQCSAYYGYVPERL